MEQERLSGWKILVVLILAMLGAASVIGGGPDSIRDAIGIQGDGSIGRRTVTIDSSTRSLCVMEYDHREIHGGFAFTVSSSSASLGSGVTFSLILQTSSSSRLLHLINQLESTGEGELQFVESPTVSASGTPQTIYNRRRDSSRVSPVRAYVGGVFTGGTVLRNFRIGAGKTTGGSSRSASEWVLKPSTVYVVLFTSRASGVYAELKSDWYEHEDKD